MGRPSSDSGFSLFLIGWGVFAPPPPPPFFFVEET
jgi:hypothetical protein